jgi:hypothetical protein
MVLPIAATPTGDSNRELSQEKNNDIREALRSLRGDAVQPSHGKLADMVEGGPVPILTREQPVNRAHPERR